MSGSDRGPCGSAVTGAAKPRVRGREMPDPSEPPNKSKRGVNGGEVVLGDGHSDRHYIHPPVAGGDEEGQVVGV